MEITQPFQVPDLNSREKKVECKPPPPDLINMFPHDLSSDFEDQSREDGGTSETIGAVEAATVALLVAVEKVKLAQPPMSKSQDIDLAFVTSISPWENHTPKVSY